MSADYCEGFLPLQIPHQAILPVSRPQEIGGLKGGLKNKEEQGMGAGVNKRQMKDFLKNWFGLQYVKQTCLAEPRVGKTPWNICFFACLADYLYQIHSSVGRGPSVKELTVSLGGQSHLNNVMPSNIGFFSCLVAQVKEITLQCARYNKWLLLSLASRFSSF